MPRLTTGEWALVAVGAAPWLWFVVRDVHPWMDAVALAWPVLGFGGAIVLALAGIVARSSELGGTSLSWLLATVAVVLLPWVPLGGGDPADPVRLVVANTFGTMTDPATMVRDVLVEDPDVLVTVETSPRLHTRLASIFGRYERFGDTVVYTRLPIDRIGRAPAGQRGVVVDMEDRFVLYALHLDKPGPNPSKVEVGFRSHRRIVDQVVDAVAAEDRPVVVAGDLNLVDRSSGYRRLTGELDDAMRAGWAGPTSLRTTTKPLLARIDHLLMPEGWCSTDSKVFELSGSDHRGVAATIGPCADEEGR